MSFDDTSFHGRRNELREVEARFEAGARLVVLVGLGGIGKTRLATEIAKASPGAVFVSLEHVRTFEGAVRALAAVARTPLKAATHARTALDAIATSLEKTDGALVVLDQLEQLQGAAREIVSGLLEKTKRLRVLGTSREPTGARGEERFVVPPLGDEDGVALLRDRARGATGTPVEISDGDALAIVRKVDGLPLAIELAASRLELLSPGELRRRLAEKIDVLAAVSGDPSATHRTMRATLDWSWDLLSEVERTALVQASVFAEPFGIDAAEEVILLDGAEVLDTLESLVKRSLLVRIVGQDGRVRLAMFHTVRAWLRERSATSDARRRHLDFHLAEAERLARSTYGERASAALDGLAELLPELLVAFDGVKEREPATATRIVLAVTDLLLFRSLFELRMELFASAVVAAERAGDDRLLARALVANARVILEDGRMQDAERELLRARTLAEAAGDEVTAAEATRSLGWALVALGRPDEAEAALATAEAAHRRHGSARGVADARAARGVLCALTGRPNDALACFREALAIHVENGDVIRQEKVLGFSGLAGHDARDVARTLPREVLTRAPRRSVDVLPPAIAERVSGERDAHQRWLQAVDLYRAGVDADARRDHAGAIDLFERAATALERAGVKSGLAPIHAHAAAAFAATGDAEEAAARIERARTMLGDDPGAEVVVDVFAAAVALRGGARAKEAAARALLERASRTEIATPQLGVATKVLLDALAGGAAPTAPASAALVVGREARWFVAAGGERVDLTRYGPIRRLLDGLVSARLERPGVALSAETLIEAGWPGERMRHSAGLLRVYSAVRRLRRLGLGEVLVTRDDGYLLDATAGVRRDDV